MRPHGKEPAKRLSRLYLAAVALLLWAAWSENGSALDAAANHSISVIVGFSPGGAYDLYARVLAKHMGKYLPGKPTLVVENMPGAGGLKAANYLYQVAPQGRQHVRHLCARSGHRSAIRPGCFRCNQILLDRQRHRRCECLPFLAHLPGQNVERCDDQALHGCRAGASG